MSVISAGGLLGGVLRVALLLDVIVGRIHSYDCPEGRRGVGEVVYRVGAKDVVVVVGHRLVGSIKGAGQMRAGPCMSSATNARGWAVGGHHQLRHACVTQTMVKTVDATIMNSF